MKRATALIEVFVLGILLCSCKTVSPDHVQGKRASYDASTPKQYSPYNSGFIEYRTISSARFGVITPNKRTEYNNLIDDYKIRFRSEEKVSISNNYGITAWDDRFGNHLFLINGTALGYFIILKQYDRDGLEPDSLWDKAKQLVRAK